MLPYIDYDTVRTNSVYHLRRVDRRNAKLPNILILGMYILGVVLSMKCVLNGFKYCCFHIVLLCYNYMQTKCFIQITNYENNNIVDCLAKEGLKTMEAFVYKL